MYIYIVDEHFNFGSPEIFPLSNDRDNQIALPHGKKKGRENTHT